jgi:hypothetical protein
MHDAAAGGHPLHAAGPEQAGIALVVAMAHAAREHVGHGLEAAMRMIGKAGDVVGALVGAELVEHQERVEIGQRLAADHAIELHAGAVAGRPALHDERGGADFAGLGGGNIGSGIGRAIDGGHDDLGSGNRNVARRNGFSTFPGVTNNPPGARGPASLC